MAGPRIRVSGSGGAGHLYGFLQADKLKVLKDRLRTFRGPGNKGFEWKSSRRVPMRSTGQESSHRTVLLPPRLLPQGYVAVLSDRKPPVCNHRRRVELASAR
jgi:hypothetical protein